MSGRRNALMAVVTEAGEYALPTARCLLWNAWDRLARLMRLVNMCARGASSCFRNSVRVVDGQKAFQVSTLHQLATTPMLR
jgi:hypothetical protein